jgi:dTDP-L-rhamnose 4-epimerase
VLNVGSGQAHTIRQVAEHMANALGKKALPPYISGKYRAGDIRHCFADISLARSILGYAPRVSFAEGLQELVEWLAGQPAYDRVEMANAELAQRGLTV